MSDVLSQNARLEFGSRRGPEPMYHEIPDPEQAVEMAAWWRQAFESPSAASPGE